MSQSAQATELERSQAGPVPPGASVRVLCGFYEGLEVPVERDWIVIGRGRSADLVISEPTISRAHAAIAFDGQEFYMQDLGSTNGTQVNGAREARIQLADGDELQLGKLRLRVALPQRG